MKGEKEEVTRWRVVEGVCHTCGAEGSVVYGVQGVVGDSVFCWEDVSASAAEATQLAALLQRLQPANCHWTEVIEDYIAALSFPDHNI